MCDNHLHSLSVKLFFQPIYSKLIKTLSINTLGGTARESSPPDLAHRSQAILKTVEDTSGQISFKILSNIKGYRQSLDFFRPFSLNLYSPLPE